MKSAINRNTYASLIAIVIISIAYSYFDRNNLVTLIVSCAVLFLTVLGTYQYKQKIFILTCLLVLYITAINANGSLAATRSLTPYLVMASIYLLLAPNSVMFDLVFDEKKLKDGLRVIFYLGFLQMIVYQVEVFFSNDYSFLVSRNEFTRASVGWLPQVCYFISMMNFARIYRHETDIKILRFYFMLFMPLFVFLNTSRTELILVLISTAFAFWIRKKILFYTFIILLTFIFGLFLARQENDRLAGMINETTTSEFNTESDAYKNYRAYENLLQIKRIQSNGLMALLGCGLGCSVKPDFYLVLNDIEYSEINVFHNGFLTILMQLGLLGLFIFYYFIRIMNFNLRNLNRYRDDLSRLGSLFCFAPIFCLLLTSFTTGGLMQPIDLLGLFPCFVVFSYARKIN